MKLGVNFVAAIVIALLAVLGSSIFTVDQRQHAIVFQLGEVRDVISKPGLYWIPSDFSSSYAAKQLRQQQL